MTSYEEYELVGWEDAPSTETPLSAENLNHMDLALGSLYRDVAELEHKVENISMSDASEMTVDFGEPGEEGVDDAPLQPSGSILRNIVTGIHSRIRALVANVTDLSTEVNTLDTLLASMAGDEVVTIPMTGTCITSGSMHYYKLGNVLFFNATVKPNQATTNVMGYVTPQFTDESITSFYSVSCYPVTGGGSSKQDNAHGLAWTFPDDIVFRIAGSFASNVDYYFGGILLINKSVENES